jgi:hypothetical protein
MPYDLKADRFITYYAANGCEFVGGIVWLDRSRDSFVAAVIKRNKPMMMIARGQQAQFFTCEEWDNLSRRAHEVSHAGPR